MTPSPLLPSPPPPTPEDPPSTALPPTSYAIYLVTLVAMAAIAIIGVLTINLVRPDKDNTSLVAQVLGFSGAITTGILIFMKQVETNSITRASHTLMNSRMDALLTAHASVARSEGVVAGMAQGVAQGEAVAVGRASGVAAGIAVMAQPLVIVEPPPSHPDNFTGKSS